MTTTPKYPADEWIRTVAFMDNSTADENDAPIHVPLRMFINGEDTAYIEVEGEQHGIRVRRDHEIEVTAALGMRETRISFVVHTDDVTVTDNGDGTGSVKIGRWNALCPPMKDRVFTEDNRPEDASEDWQPYTVPGTPWEVVDSDDSGDWIRVVFFADEVHFAQADLDVYVPDNMGDVDRVVLYSDKAGRFRWAYRAAGNASNMGGPHGSLASKEQALSNAARVTGRELVADLTETKGLDANRLLLVDLT